LGQDWLGGQQAAREKVASCVHPRCGFAVGVAKIQRANNRYLFLGETKTQQNGGAALIETEVFQSILWRTRRYSVSSDGVFVEIAGTERFFFRE
jgi:hypothetical protein